jgi:hypothetical protein
VISLKINISTNVTFSQALPQVQKENPGLLVPNLAARIQIWSGLRQLF